MSTNLANWDMVRCSVCGGHGLTAGWGGMPDDCRDCNGGVLYRHRPSGTLALWPGGQLMGSDKGFHMTVLKAGV